jgi:alkanesulfonate monooxygenase SsuD/methylene tetrahydromethanopterin reductase-like flavin-dependent oxidoreductase (luciferase family)
MQIGIGLPSHISHGPGPLNVEWAHRAEQRGFASVATIDRLVYESVDSIVALVAAAGATRDIGLVTNVLLAALYPAALLAKQLASVAEIAGDRLAVGLGVGSRPDDYTAVGVDYRRRGHVLARLSRRRRRLPLRPRPERPRHDRKAGESAQRALEHFGVGGLPFAR